MHKTREFHTFTAWLKPNFSMNSAAIIAAFMSSIHLTSDTNVIYANTLKRTCKWMCARSSNSFLRSPTRRVGFIKHFGRQLPANKPGSEGAMAAEGRSRTRTVFGYRTSISLMVQNIANRALYFTDEFRFPKTFGNRYRQVKHRPCIGCIAAHNSGGIKAMRFIPPQTI